MMTRTMPTKSSARDDDGLYERVAQILEQSRGRVARSVNTAMVQAYWLVGREIVEVEQAGEQRAGYGQNVLARLAARLRAREAWATRQLEQQIGSLLFERLANHRDWPRAGKGAAA